MQCDLFGWLENEVYSGSMIKESDVPSKLTEFQKYHILNLELIIGTEAITLDPPLKRWRVQLSMLQQSNTSRAQIHAPTLLQTRCSCWMPEQTTSRMLLKPADR